jgi:hypothetical protein
LIHHLDQPTGQPTESKSHAPDRPNPARPHELKHSRMSRLPLRAQSRLTPHEPKRPRAPRPTRLSHFSFLLSHFSYRAQSFYDFVNHSYSDFNHSCYSAQPFLLQWSAILENSVIPHCYSAQPFLIQCSTSFTKQQCSANFAIVLSHSFYNAKSF